MPRKPEQSWFQDAVEAYVREGKPLRQFVVERGLEISGADCDKIFGSKRFQEALWAERAKYSAEIANTPGRDKTSLVGLTHLLIYKLIEQGDFDKAVNAIEKLAKIEGFLGADTNISVFAGLTANDIEKAKAELSQPSKPTKDDLSLLN